ncbi:MAG: hypothetical protein AAF385_06180, partial [Pseudomonadota bacterium]
MSDDVRTLKEAFSIAVALEGDPRDKYLKRFNAEHPQLAAELSDLLLADSDDRELEAPIAGTADSLVKQTQDPWLGRSIGPWQLSRRIGEGGMGAVFLSQRSDAEFEQVAALK